MVDIVFRKTFRKKIDSRIRINTKIYNRFLERLKIFCKDTNSPILRDHQLTGEMSKNRAFSITDDVRVVYQIVDDNTVEFFDIGTHEQVYKK